MCVWVGAELKTDESAMTGETHDIPKNDVNPILLSGTQVTAGVGYMLITAVGPDSEWGITLSRLTDESDPTPLQVRPLSSPLCLSCLPFLCVCTGVEAHLRWAGLCVSVGEPGDRGDHHW